MNDVLVGVTSTGFYCYLSKKILREKVKEKEENEEDKEKEN